LPLRAACRSLELVVLRVSTTLFAHHSSDAKLSMMLMIAKMTMMMMIDKRLLNSMSGVCLALIMDVGESSVDFNGAIPSS
jgi:hypothetical protein